jgi:hypothetical protein
MRLTLENAGKLRNETSQLIKATMAAAAAASRTIAPVRPSAATVSNTPMK